MNLRLKLLRFSYLLVFSGFFLVFVRVIQLQQSSWASPGNISLKEQSRVVLRQVALRGKIVDRNGQTLAQSVKRWDLFADPAFLNSQNSDLEKLSRQLAEKFNIAENKLWLKLKRNTRFVSLKKNLTLEEKRIFEAWKPSGLGITESQKRIYPEKSRLSHVLGYLDDQGRGVAGLEKQMELRLQSQEGSVLQHVDVQRRPVEKKVNISVAHEGKTVKSTLDVSVQRIVDKALSHAFDFWRPVSAVALVMRPESGEILALSVFPGFDAGNIQDEDMDHLLNPVLSACFEPGSIFKPFIWAAAYEEALIRPAEQIFCEPGGWKLPGRILHDHHPHAWLSAREVLIKSSNVGMAKIAEKLMRKKSFSGNRMDHWIRKFGFGRKSSVDLPGEIRGLFKKAEDWEKTSWVSLAMGHEIAVTPLQYLRAFCVFANGGYLVSPHVLLGKSTVKRQKIIRSETADLLSRILLDVVEKGTGRRAAIEGIEVAGKTGTAQKLVTVKKGTRRKKQYSHDQYISSFAAFAPLVNPKIAVLVVFDNPHREGVSHPFGGVVAAPVVREIIRNTLDYLQFNPLKRSDSFGDWP
jgi:cell division protein FtsI (penicillin-binding protein 3)